jgi:methylmalonyl-CoA/ethylmalonyl-CoA epimerase
MIPLGSIKNYFGENAEFEHAGIAVKSIKDAVKEADITEDPIQKVKVAFISINGFRIELIEPIADKSPVTKFLEKGQSLYHICFRVPDIRIAIDTARKNGFHCIAKPVPAKAFNEKNIAWVFSKVYGLFELVETA